jgi:hypothetical protein
MSDINRQIEKKIAKVNEMLQKASLLEKVIEELAGRVNEVYFGLKSMQEHIKTEAVSEEKSDANS